MLWEEVVELSHHNPSLFKSRSLTKNYCISSIIQWLVVVDLQGIAAVRVGVKYMSICI